MAMIDATLCKTKPHNKIKTLTKKMFDSDSYLQLADFLK